MKHGGIFVSYETWRMLRLIADFAGYTLADTLVELAAKEGVNIELDAQKLKPAGEKRVWLHVERPVTEALFDLSRKNGRTMPKEILELLKTHGDAILKEAIPFKQAQYKIAQEHLKKLKADYFTEI